MWEVVLISDASSVAFSVILPTVTLKNMWISSWRMPLGRIKDHRINLHRKKRSREGERESLKNIEQRDMTIKNYDIKEQVEREREKD